MQFLKIVLLLFKYSCLHFSKRMDQKTVGLKFLDNHVQNHTLEHTGFVPLNTNQQDLIYGKNFLILLKCFAVNMQKSTSFSQFLLM